VVKPGAAQIAITANVPVVAAKLIVKGAWRLKSWDRIVIPFPFAKITVVISEPIVPSETMGLEAITQQIQEYLTGGEI
jgi:lysophospholipid acyltransferase (LPLAT)-like uncharacterized protein